MTKIKIIYRSVDGYRETRSFSTLSGARRYAAERVGEHPEIGSSYAVSGDGVGKIVVDGVSLADLFPSESAEDERLDTPYEEFLFERGVDRLTDLRPARDVGCVCSDEQLVYVGCECSCDGVRPFLCVVDDAFADMPF